MQIGLLAPVFLLCSIGCGFTNHGQSAANVESEILRLESAKWHPSSLGASEKFIALFADDFVTVQYGADLHSGVERKFGFKTSMSKAEGTRFRQLLEQTHFELSQWRFIHLDSTGVVASYKVGAPSLEWKAFATSVWAKREGRWETVFYQASTAK